MINKPPVIVAAIAITLFVSTIGTAKTNKTRSQAAQLGTFEARVEGLMRQSGYDFRKVKANSWYLTVPGREMAQIRIILGAGPSSIAMGAVVLPKRSLRMNAEAFHKLMKLSYDLNYVRVCVDADDDLIVMSQKKDAWLTVDEFKNTVNQVSAAADRAYAVMKPYLTGP